MESKEQIETYRRAFHQRAGELACLEALDLANLTNEEALRRLRALGSIQKPWRERPDWPGLVELQALLHRRSAQ